MRVFSLFWGSLFITSGQDQSHRYLGLVVRPNSCFQLWLAFLHSQTLLFTSHFHTTAHATSYMKHLPQAPPLLPALSKSHWNLCKALWVHLNTCHAPSVSSYLWCHLQSSAAPGTPRDGTVWVISVPPTAGPPTTGPPKSQARAYAQETLAWVGERAAFILVQVNSSVGAEGWIITAWL